MFNNQDLSTMSEEKPMELHFGMYEMNQSCTPNVAPYSFNIQQNNYPIRFDYENVNAMTTPLSSSLQERKKNEIDFEHALKEIEQNQETKDSSNPRKKCNIALTRNAIISILKLNNQVKDITEELKNDLNLSEIEWNNKIKECYAAKCKILELLQKLKDDDFMKGVKKNLEKRKRKRCREKRRRIKWKEEKSRRAEKIERLHKEADNWIISKQTEIEREKQEESLRKDADIVLSSVRSKKSDVRKYFGLLQELQNLRRIKSGIAQARGEHLSPAIDQTFQNIIVKLMEQWKTLDSEYSVEEQGLKLMLKTDNEKRIQKQEKNIFDDWENVLFGGRLRTFTHFHKNINSFIMLRFAWDKFISYDNDATPIPIGWIVPDKPSSAAWQKCLKTV